MNDTQITDLALNLLGTARGILESGREAVPILAVVHTDGEMTLGGITFTGEAEKDAFAGFLRSLAAKPDTDWLLFLSDSWLTTIDGVRRTRREALTITVQGARGERWLASQTYKRNGKSLVFDGVQWQKECTLEGRFSLATHPN